NALHLLCINSERGQAVVETAIYANVVEPLGVQAHSVAHHTVERSFGRARFGQSSESRELFDHSLKRRDFAHYRGGAIAHSFAESRLELQRGAPLVISQYSLCRELNRGEGVFYLVRH